MRRVSIVLFVGFLAILTTIFGSGEYATVSSQSPVRLSDDSVVSFRVRFGMTDTEPRSWDGKLQAQNGEVLQLRNWNPHPSEKIDGTTGWSMATRKGMNYIRRVYQKEDPRGTITYLVNPGIVVDVRASRGTRVRFETRNGRFEVWPAELSVGQPQDYLDGAVIVDRVPSAEQLSSPDFENDFATILAGKDGEIWAAWVAYRNQSNVIFARRFDGASWEPAVQVNEKPGDIFLVKLGRDRKGRPWAVWSEQVNGNFDLHARYLESGSWSAPQRLSRAPQPDIQHSLTTDAHGNLWLVWQGFRGGKSDVFARRYDGSSWSPEEKLSPSPANDWKPAITADKEGSVYVAWDTYDKGNYDVVMRRFEGGKWSATIPVADTPLFEAHVSLACDSQNRLWAAWNESGFQWGKDSGFLVLKEATRLYQWRSMGLGIYSGGRWQAPARDLNEALPEDLRGYNDLPILQSDAASRMWVFFRHRLIRSRDTPDFTPAHRAAWQIYGTAYDGERWSEPLHVPFSRGRQDVRWGVAADSEGSLFAAWPTDHRNSDDFLFQKAEVYAAKLPQLAGEAKAPQLKDPVIREMTTYSVHPNEADDLARIRDYKIESGGKTYRIYRGDTHRHTEFSADGFNDGSLLETYRYALDAADLDFLGVSEHNSGGGQDVEYINWVIPQISDVFHLAASFVPIYTYERSLSYPNGHRNVLVAKRGIPTLPLAEAERQGEEGAAKLYAYLKRYNAIAISHTSATGMGTDWRDNDPEVEPLVEIYQGDRVSAEYEGAPRAATREKASGQQGGFRPAGFVWNAWKKGYKLGVQASSDHISTHISYACTIAEDFTREGLLDAMRKRHSYGATDNIVLDYRLQAAGKEYLQGDIVEVSGPFKLWVKILGTADIRQIDIIKNNTFVHNRQNLPREVSFTFVDNDVTPGESYYYVRVIQNNEEMAWSSPIWVKKR